MASTPDILFVTQAGETLPSVRFRVLPYVRLAKERGLTAEHLRLPKTFARRLPWYLGLLRKRPKVLILQKKLPARWELALLKAGCGALAYDFDDAVWTSHPSEPPGDKRDRREAKDAKRFARVCQSVDLILAGNEYLAEQARNAGAKAVHVLPTPLDTTAYTPPPKARMPDKPVIGWMGTSSNLYFLPKVMEELAPLANRARFLLVADRAPAKTPFPLEFQTWRPDQEIARLQSMDIGLMPLTDDAYTRGKCGFKILQYMACGAVPVASAVGFNTEVVEHGRTGFLVNEPGQWAEYVTRLLNEPDLRRTMAARAREAVAARFDLAPAFERLLQALNLA